MALRAIQALLTETGDLDMAGLTPDYEGDGLNLAGHLTGDPVSGKGNGPMPSGGIAWSMIVGAVVLLTILWFVFKGVRI